MRVSFDNTIYAARRSRRAGGAVSGLPANRPWPRKESEKPTSRDCSKFRATSGLPKKLPVHVIWSPADRDERHVTSEAIDPITRGYSISKGPQTAICKAVARTAQARRIRPHSTCLGLAKQELSGSSSPEPQARIAGALVRP